VQRFVCLLFGRASLLLFGSLFGLRDHSLARSDWRNGLWQRAFPHSFSLDQEGTPKILRSLGATCSQIL
jgi:hypothetical protein